jgi:oligopeptide/dipeptide ABC transporter ATP-binding protein
VNEATGILLSVRDLGVRYALGDGGELAALDGVGLDLDAGETLGVLGESGSGKSSLALAISRLLPASASLAGSIRLHGRELTGLAEREMTALRGASIGIVYQEPGLALNPVLRAGAQVEEVLRAHRPGPARTRRAEALAALEAVGLERVHFDAYPHELSGGQRQRVVIAQAIACRPALLVADEPTTALDAVTKAGILDLLVELRERLGLSVLLISHDPAVLTAVAERLIVLYAGRLVEEGPLAAIRAEPFHPYTRALFEAVSAAPAPETGYGRRLVSIPGGPPDLRRLPRGCAFEPRCPARVEACATRRPGETRPAPARRVACVHHGG